MTYLLRLETCVIGNGWLASVFIDGVCVTESNECYGETWQAAATRAMAIAEGGK